MFKPKQIVIENTCKMQIHPLTFVFCVPVCFAKSFSFCNLANHLRPRFKLLLDLYLTLCAVASAMFFLSVCALLLNSLITLNYFAYIRPVYFIITINNYDFHSSVIECDSGCYFWKM